MPSQRQIETADPEVNRLLVFLIARLQAVLGSNLTGLYLFGSLVWGDFDSEISDIDLLCITGKDIDGAEFGALDRMHSQLVEDFPRFHDRIEIAYLSRAGLLQLAEFHSPIAMISPGEPFHIKEAGRDWLLNLYIIQQKGRAIFGPSFSTLISPIPKPEFLTQVKMQAEEWREWIIHTRSSRPYQGYAILTLCRALYAVKNGEQVSKRQAAEWVINTYPEYAGAVRAALRWRSEYRTEVDDPESTYPQTERVINELIDLMGIQ